MPNGVAIMPNGVAIWYF